MVARILLVERTPTIRLAIKAALELHDCLVDDVESGEKAIRLTEKKNYSLVLIDLQIMDISSFETAKQVLKSDQRSVIIALTSDPSAELLRRCAEANMAGFLMKPVDLRRVLPYIREASLFNLA